MVTEVYRNIYRENGLVPSLDTEAMYNLRVWARILASRRSLGDRSDVVAKCEQVLREEGQYLTREELRRNGLIIPFVRYEDYHSSAGGFQK